MCIRDSPWRLLTLTQSNTFISSSSKKLVLFLTQSIIVCDSRSSNMLKSLENCCRLKEQGTVPLQYLTLGQKVKQCTPKFIATYVQ